MDMDEEYGQDTPTPMPRGGEMGSQTGGQMNENAMIRMMMNYMEKQDKRMEMLIQKLESNSSSLSTTQDPISEYQKNAKAKLEGKHVIILNRFINYLKWKSSILADAHLIQAKDVLIKGETIFQSLNITVRDSLGPLNEDAYLAVTIWKNLARHYTISRAEERLLTTKKMRDLHLKNSDFHTYLANFRDLKTKLEFIRMKLDEFYATKQSPIQNLNLDDLMNQLAMRVTINMPATITHPFTASPVTEQFDKHQCHYCNNTGHIIKYC
ncbi:uncharacterized protein BDCG_17029 [Blastomyces dermatitidis ER-3]|uniref:CCHC-type domain-containing protein n=1 Tax=Ajellomyces dermatitidis (strain ER-3 / ATCC MYA-2586) TaxID=559297 RepID=A0ABX2VVY1_AJEDR|nr:uncharacterized protein BDCG_17029 [Blastomyces dermatitidis ER-3]OAT01309.1 hypothetical protein BDCG_17029 [Blastomyces dermatitidis ER-3]